MKRSDMVAELDKFIDTELESPVGDLYLNADTLLKFIEERMLPIPYEVELSSTPNVSLKENIFGWEDE